MHNRALCASDVALDWAEMAAGAMAERDRLAAALRLIRDAGGVMTRAAMRDGARRRAGGNAMSKSKKSASPAIDAAEAEARRFLARVAETRLAMQAFDVPEWRGDVGPNRTDVPRENAALKRASLDLSRALAALRRSNYA